MFQGFHTTNVVALVLFGMATLAHAETEFPLETGNTGVRFNCSAGLMAVAGRFEVVQGRVILKDDGWNPSAIQVDIESGSLTTGSAMTDRQLKGSNFFDSAHHPMIVFRSTAIVWTSASQAQIAGLLSLKAVTRPVTLQVELDPKFPYDAPSGLGREDVTNAHPTLRASTRIRRSDFDMAGFTPFIGDECDIQIRVVIPEGVLKE